MKKLFILMTIVLVAGFTGCRFDDSDLWDELKDQKKRLTQLEQKVESLNTDIQSIRTIVQVLQSRDMITDITELSDGSGYEISFVSHPKITIKNGQKGADGTTPAIAVVEEGGVYYWTVNGQIIEDASGNKLPVTGNNGADGQNAIAPQLRINENTMEWEISTNGGTTWESTGIVAEGQDGPAGSNGDSFFSSVNTGNPEYVIFTLTGGTTFNVPCYAALSLTFENLNEGVFDFMADGSENIIRYTNTGTIAKIGIASSVPAGWTVKADMQNNRIRVSSSVSGEVDVLVVATTKDGISASYWITLSAAFEAVSSITDLNTAISNAPVGGVILLEAGTYMAGTPIELSKNVTLKGVAGAEPVIQVSGNTPAIQVSGAAVTIDGITIEQTVDAISELALIHLTGNVDGAVIQNSTFIGSYDLESNDGQVVRAILADAGRSLTIIGNTFKNVRQPAYIEGPAIIKDNYTEGTKGWVITQNSIVDMTGNTFGTNAVDIAIIQNKITTDLGNYNDARILELHNLNGNAHVENQVTDNGATTSTYNSVSKDGTTYNWVKP